MSESAFYCSNCLHTNDVHDHTFCHKEPSGWQDCHIQLCHNASTAAHTFVINDYKIFPLGVSLLPPINRPPEAITAALHWQTPVDSPTSTPVLPPPPVLLPASLPPTMSTPSTTEHLINLLAQQVSDLTNTLQNSCCTSTC